MQRFNRAATACAAALLALGLSACAPAEAPDCGGLEVSEPWVREAAPGAGVMAAYFTLDNGGETRVVVNGVSSTQFERAEMHQTVVNDDGQASMQPMARVAVPAGEQVAFEAGGRHVMLFSPRQTYAAGDQVELILSCGSQNAELPVPAIVRASAPGAAASQSGSHAGMNHGDADAGGAQGAAADGASDGEAAADETHGSE